MTQTHKRALIFLAVVISTIGVLLYLENIEAIHIPGMSQTHTTPLSTTVAFNPAELPKAEPTKTTTNQTGKARRVSYIGRIEEARKLIDHGYFTEANVELLRALQEKPDILTPYLLMGEIHIQTKNYDKLTALIQEIQTRFPAEQDVVQTMTMRGLLADRQFSTALAYIDSIQDPIAPEVKYYQALLLGLQNNHARASQILNELQRLRVEKRTLTIGAEGVQETIETRAKDEEMSISPEFAAKVTDFAVIYDEFETVREGEQAHLLTLVAKELAERKEYALSVEFAKTAIAESIEYIDAWIVRGFGYLQMGDNDKAESDLRHAYKLDTNRPATQYFLALALVEQKNSEEAILFFEQALAYNFEFSEEVRWKLVDLYIEVKNFDKVESLYKELIDTQSAPEKFVSALHTSIEVLNKPEIALELSEKLVSDAPNDVFFLNMNGWALIANGQFREAKKVLEDAKELAPEDPRTYLNLGLLEEEQDKPRAAAEQYKKAYEIAQAHGPADILNVAAERYNALISEQDLTSEPDLVNERMAESP